MMDAASFRIVSRPDVERACRQVRRMAASLGFSATDAEAVVLSASELATNLVRYAREGRLTVRLVASDGARPGLRLESSDLGPGITDLGLALQDGYSSGGGLGSGLPAVRRLMDGFEIESSPAGTRIMAVKWALG